MLRERYQKDIIQAKAQTDKAQAKVIETLQEALERIVARENSLAGQLAHYLPMPLASVKGVYLWGGVGRGKTYLMDLFYEALPIKRKKRLHFHHFMMQVHQQLAFNAGMKNPLSRIAKTWRKEFVVLCFDEFYVSDVADAMIIASLLPHLLKSGITLIATSNIEPDNLYPNGLQRDKFLPAIELIKAHTKVMHLESGIDYRLAFLTKADLFHYPLDSQARINLEKYFNALAPTKGIKNKIICIQNRKIPSIIEADSIIWFAFVDICGGTRSQYDYIEIAKLYHTVLISDVTIMNDGNNDVAKRFILMIDEFYERHVALIMSIEVDFPALYQGTALRFEFQRTVSRLQEMGSKDYLSKAHIA